MHCIRDCCGSKTILNIIVRVTNTMSDKNSLPSTLLTTWSAEISSFLDRGRSAALGLFDLTGQPLYLNGGLSELLDIDEADQPAHLITPPQAAIAVGGHDVPAYRGLLAFGGPDDLTRTLSGEIWRRGDELLVLAEPSGSCIARLDEKAQFAHAAAHDLRGPLGNIQVAAHYMLDEADGLQEEDVVLLSVIVEQSEKALALVEDIRRLAEIEAEQFALKLASLDVRHCIGEVVEVQREASDRDVSIEYTAEGDVTIQADAHRVQQALSYLILNAIARSPEGGTVRVHSQPEADSLRVSVADAGPCINEGQQAHLFASFDRRTGKLAGRGPKTGLELALARLIVEAHGGQIGLTSGPEEDTVFWMTLPRRS